MGGDYCYAEAGFIRRDLEGVGYGCADVEKCRGCRAALWIYWEWLKCGVRDCVGVMALKSIINMFCKMEN